MYDTVFYAGGLFTTNDKVGPAVSGIKLATEAKAYLDESIEAQKHMLDNYPSLQKQYQPGDGNNEVFYLKEVKAIINAFGKEPEVYEF